MKPEKTQDADTWTGAANRCDWLRDIDADPLHVDEEPYATVARDRSPAVIVWMLGAIVAALIVVVAIVVWHGR